MCLTDFFYGTTSLELVFFHVSANLAVSKMFSPAFHYDFIDGTMAMMEKRYYDVREKRKTLTHVSAGEHGLHGSGRGYYSWKDRRHCSAQGQASATSTYDGTSSFSSKFIVNPLENQFIVHLTSLPTTLSKMPAQRTGKFLPKTIKIFTSPNLKKFVTFIDLSRFKLYAFPYFRNQKTSTTLQKSRIEERKCN